MSNPIDSTFTSSGVTLVGGSSDMTHLYGLSDFFTFLFEDSDKLSTILEATAYPASDIYSNFLQQTSGLSIDNVQTYLGVSIKLLLVEDSYEVTTTQDPNVIQGTKFKLPYPVANAKFLANRPFLPTETLEYQADFTIEQIDENSCYLILAKPLADYKFSIRKASSGVTQTAIWATDVSLDAQFVSNNFAPLVGRGPKLSTDKFSEFIYGLFYLYWNGPTTALIERGLNLTLGVPLARATEAILDIRTYSNTSQYLVITNQFQYLLPENAVPSKGIGDVLEQGEPLSFVVEVKDFTKDGIWWEDVSIPSYIIQHKPSSQLDRFAKPGTAYYQLMADRLKNHCFLVRINNESLSGEVSVSDMFDVLSRAKPSYTQPILVTKISLGSDVLPPVIDFKFTSSVRATGLGGINFQAINEEYIN